MLLAYMCGLLPDPMKADEEAEEGDRPYVKFDEKEESYVGPRCGCYGSCMSMYVISHVD
jgi:hypothetical protein